MGLALNQSTSIDAPAQSNSINRTFLMVTSRPSHDSAQRMPEMITFARPITKLRLKPSQPMATDNQEVIAAATASLVVVSSSLFSSVSESQWTDNLAERSEMDLSLVV